MKVFMITWGVILCSGHWGGYSLRMQRISCPGVPATQVRSEEPDLSKMPINRHKSGQVGLEVEDSRNGAEAECSPV